MRSAHACALAMLLLGLSLASCGGGGGAVVVIPTGTPLAIIEFNEPAGSAAISTSVGIGYGYETAPFVRLRDPQEALPSVRHVAGTNFCDLAPVADEAGGSTVIVGVIDNLLKGAAGQAVQLFNLAFGRPETEGLLPASGEARP